MFISSSLASLTPVSSVTIPSTTLSYSSTEEGSWQITKSASWLSKGKARINIKLNTVEKLKSDYTDVILVLDTSGSMLGSKLTQVQTDINNLINDTIPKGNKIALITFSDSATIVSNFTDDTTVLQESINNLVASGETNYYQALVKVDEILSTYTKEDNKNCVVLFLTDGLPTIDTPNEVGEYKYLKSKYEYLDINGIQYELGDTVLTGIKNITDIQYLANKENLDKFLYQASLSTATYDEFILTDYIDTNYFNLDNVTDITTSLGTASINNNNKVIWDLSGIKSGTDATLKIDINFNVDLVGVGGIYPTHTKTDVAYKIGSTSTTESSTKTTVLKDKYTVVYEGNTPSGCVVSNVPSTSNYFVFDTVQKESTIPVCAGYQFKGWEIVTSGVEEINDDTFIMPEKNVTLRAIWKKLTLKKSSTGTVVKEPTLYNLIADNSIGLDTDVDFSKSPTDANSGVYTIAGTGNDNYPVHYYRGNVDNNNIVFAGFCWKMVRTTSTGGVKLVYNGTYEKNAVLSISESKYINVSNSSSYPFTFDDSNNTWTSTNKKDSSTGTISFSPAESGSYVLSYSISSEYNRDGVFFYKDGTRIGAYSGIQAGKISLGELTSDNIIKVKYEKNSSGSAGSDSVTFSLDKVTDDLVNNCDNTGTSSQIGTSEFNSAKSSPADVGYMYGNRYTTEYNSVSSSIKILNRYYIGSNSYYYGDSITYSNGTYTLQNAEKKSWSSNYTNLVGYYTCKSTSTTCSTVYYIVATEEEYQNVLSLSDGLTDPNGQIITLGKSVIFNGDGTYNLKDIVTLKKIDWYNNYNIYANYFTCNDLISNTCSELYSIYETTNLQIKYDMLYSSVFGNDVTWDGTKYSLVDTYTLMNSWALSRNNLSEKYYYTCLNTTGECTKVYYIYFFGSDYGFYSLSLTSGKKIEDLKTEMFTNESDSSIKNVIDSWYKENLVDYTDKFEDTIFCNDRDLYTDKFVRKNVENGINYPLFNTYDRVFTKYNPSVECSNASRDGFTVSANSGGNGKLTYPVGLLTADEAMLAGGLNVNNGYYYLYTGEPYWLLSPSAMYAFASEYFSFVSATNFGIYSDGYLLYDIMSSSAQGVRPSVSLAPGTKVSEGVGTVDDPFIVE